MPTYFPQEEVIPWFTILTKIFVYISAVVSILMIPLHFALLIMSLDPGFGLYFILVSLVMIVKCVNVVYFFLYFYTKITDLSMFKIVFLTGEAVVGITLIVLDIQIIGITHNFFSLFSNPFVYDFGLFVIATGMMLSILFFNPTSYEYAYYPANLPAQGTQFVNPQLYKNTPAEAPIADMKMSEKRVMYYIVPSGDQ